jgi:hypothetical protein
MLTYSKIAQNRLLGSLKSVFSYFEHIFAIFNFLLILVDFLLKKRIFEKLGGYYFCV